MTKKNILVLIPYYFPGYKMGGPQSSVSGMVHNLGNEFNFLILTSDRDMGDEKPYPNIPAKTWLDRVDHFIYYVPRNLFTLFFLLREINRTPNDFLYLNSFFHPIFSIAIAAASKIGIIRAGKLIIAPRGELFDEALNFKRTKKRIYLWLASKFGIYKNVRWHASTEHEKEFIVKKMRVDDNAVRVAMNMSIVTESDGPGVEENAKDEGSSDYNDLRIIFLSRISKDKNLGYTFDILSKVKNNIIFDIYGPIEDESLWNSFQTKINNLPPSVKVNYRGSVKKDEVKNTLRKYDLLFLPTFAENYGHVIVEALTVGTPVLISDNTPWRNLYASGLGWDLSLERPDLFIDAINNMTSDIKCGRLKSRKEIVDIFRRSLNDSKILDANRQLFSCPFG